MIKCDRQRQFSFLVPKKSHGFYLVLGIFLVSQLVWSQDNSQYWTDYNISKKINERFSWSSGFGFRTISPYAWSRIYASPTISYDWPRLIMKNMRYKEKLLGGIDIFYTDNKNVPDQLEIRPFQGYSISAPNLNHLIIKHTFKLEERFEISMNDWTNTFGLRMSYEFLLTLRFNGDFWEAGKGFYLPMDAKFFWNLVGTKQFNDKARVTFGLGREFNEAWKAAFTIGYNYSRTGSNEAFDTGDILFRLRVYHRL